MKFYASDIKYLNLILMLFFLLTPNKIISAAALDAHFSHACAIQPDNTVVCWGLNNNGQSNPSSGTFLQISAGKYHTCGIRADNTVACWGAKQKARDYGQTTPPNGTFHQISAGFYHTCGVSTDKTVQCWGKNYAIPPLGTFYEVSAGKEHTCGIRTDNTITCWGNPLKIGISNPASGILRPSDVIGGDILTPPNGRFSQLSTFATVHCALGIDSNITCWGDNFDKQAMPPNYPFWDFALEKQSVSANDTYSLVASHRSATCAIRTDNAIVCWGFQGEYPYTPPNGSCTCFGEKVPRCLCSNQPTPSNGFTLVTGGFMFVCGIQKNNKVACWGRDGEHADESDPLPPRAIPPEGLIVKSSEPDCLLYGVYENKSRENNFFIINYPGLDANPRGRFDKSKNYNIEALDIHPLSNQLYAVSGKKANEKKGYLYNVSNGAYILNEIGSTGLAGINAISFHPAGKLWGWTQGKGLFEIENVDNNKPDPKVILSYSGEVKIEDITWDNGGAIIYGVENLYGESVPDNTDETSSNNFKGVRLYAYDNVSKSVSAVCNELMGSLKTEVAALDTLPNNNLLFGFRKNASLSFGVIDIKRCEMTMEVAIPSDYNGMKSMAWPDCTP